MKCATVEKQLSWFLDDVLDADRSDRISEHLDQCSKCRTEFARLNHIRRKLGSLKSPEAPGYLRHLLELRLETAARQTWRESLRNAVEYRWSKIRTTERMWYLTRALGTLTTSLFFLAISASMNPLYELGFRQQVAPEKALVLQTLREQLLKNVGLIPMDAQKKHAAPTEPMINPLYLVNLGENASRKARDDTFSVVTVVDRSGAAKIQNVLEYPEDSSLLSDLNSMLMTARYRPAVQNGRAVESHLVMSFSRVSVYDQEK
jgi:hypothetical protein